MPTDADGNRADIVMDAFSTINRMNIGRLYEQYINSASRDVVKKIVKDLGLVKGEKGLASKLANLEIDNSNLFNRTWNYLLDYYRIVSPKMFVWFTDGEYRDTRANHLASIINNGIYLYLPPDNEPESTAIVEELEKHFKPTFTPVSYVGTSKERSITKLPVRIGSMYIILLEKTADDWTAVSSGKLQHFGILSQVTNSDKFAQPSRNQAIRAWGEAEVRLLVSFCGSDIAADILDRNNNAKVHGDIVKNILEADTPTNIDIAVNRELFPIGNSKPLTLIRHTVSCSGFKFVYKPHDNRQWY